MRLFPVVGFLMLCHLANAQVAPKVSGAPGVRIDSAGGKVIHICVPSKSALLQPAPLFIIKSQGDEFKLKNAEIVKPDWIQSIDILKDSVTVNKYGPEAKSGVVIFTIKDEEYPEAYKLIKTASLQK